MLLETYSPSHMRAILHGLGLDIRGETPSGYLCLCPYHSNRDTPSFFVSHEKGMFNCFNPSCSSSGTVITLVQDISHRNYYESVRFILNIKEQSVINFDDELAELLSDKPDFEEFSQETLDKLYGDIDGRAESYFMSRGITRDSIDYFKLGYSKNMDMVIVPVHSPDGIPVGLVGRSIEGKKFKNSNNLPRNKTMFNMHRAKRQGGTIIVVESSFDAIRLYESGFPNAVATLGGSLSDENIENLDRYSSKIIIATDADEAGRKLGLKIATKLSRKEVLWASYEYGKVYPEGKKDIGDLTNEEIRQCIINAVPHYEYANW